MNFFKADSLKKVFLHLGIMFILFMGLLIFFFYVYLPNATHHNETITVPKLIGMNATEMDDFLSSRDLRFKINDSTYSPGVKAYTILNQHPLPNSKVKENRMIYITVAAKNPPNVAMPDFINFTTNIRQAQLQLKQHDLILVGTVEVPGEADIVYDQLSNGKRIAPGTMIPKGTRITLKVGKSDGQQIPVPELVGMDVNSARSYAQDLGLLIEVRPDPNATEGTIIKQKPESTDGATIQTGQTIDVWTE
ncbi:MAG: PASTA domain-containing protein [Cytophagaceae bacterium]|nr:PASTA domain-containing protein [Cytophagaceae bacterium]